MTSTRPRGGIERKILTSILWVGILPMALALLAGYLTARGGQSSAVQKALATDARRTAAGLVLAGESLLRPVEILANDPALIAALDPGAAGTAPLIADEVEHGLWQERLARMAEADAPHHSVLAILSPSGEFVVASGEGYADLNLPPEQWVGRVPKARFLDIDYDSVSKRLTAFMVAPVAGGSDGGVLGYLGQIVEISSLVVYALGAPTSMDAAQDDDFYELIFSGPGDQLMSIYLGEGSTEAAPVLQYGEVDAAVAARMMGPGAPQSGSTRLPRYTSRGATRDVYLAHHRIFDRNDLFLVVYRPAAAVFSDVNLWALLAVGTSVIFIFFLCVNAYRKVHTNIIQPVSLLNEGAQIIRRGDLDLKLKIQTGDEIEELATSFNQMALALSKNIGQLEESEEKYRSLFTSMRDGIYQTDPDGTIILLNRAGVEILGFGDVDDAIGKNLRDLFVNPLDYDKLAREFEEKGFVERTRLWLKHQEGRLICVEISGNRVYDDAGATMEVEGIFRDVTTSVRLEQEARERSERISAINQIANVINSSLEAGRLYESLVVEVKKLVNFDYAALALLDGRSSKFETRQLWPEKVAAPPALSEVAVEESCAAWVARERQCLLVDDLQAPGSPFANQFPADARSCLCVPLYATGRIIGTLNLGLSSPHGFTVHDVEVLEQMAPHVAVAIRNAQLLENLQVSLEEVTRAREKLHEVNEELKTLDEMKTNLLSNVSHELRTPLVSVMGYTDMIYNGKVGPVNAAQQEYLGISLRNVEKLVTLIENLLDFSRLNRGAEKLVFDSFDLVECARASVQIIQPVADGREIRLVVNAPSEPVLVEGDKGKLGQVFNNLLSNAVKFNDHGGSITIEIQPSDDSVEVRVIDTGIGIPQEAWDKVFTRFYQYDSSSTRKYGGTGIGLSIAQDIVRLHGSRIRVTSEVGKGSTFTFSLPLMSVRRDGTEGPMQPLPRETHLLVELVSQDRALSLHIRNLLASEGMEMIHATAPANAIALAQKHRPDCILVDAEENGQGQATLDDLYVHPVVAAVPIVLLTNDGELFNRYRSMGASWVKRSFRKSSLLSGIHYALSKGMDVGEPLGDKILCVDDDLEVVTFIRRCLTAEGYLVEACKSGEEALELLETRDYSMVLLDIAMPGLDGWETCRRIKSDAGLAGVKVYLVTAKPLDGSTPRVHEAGADGYILKPFRPEDLIELVQGAEIFHPLKKV
jgi:PAS domain S-box-containing protein